MFVDIRTRCNDDKFPEFRGLEAKNFCFPRAVREGCFYKTLNFGRFFPKKISTRIGAEFRNAQYRRRLPDWANALSDASLGWWCESFQISYAHHQNTPSLRFRTKSRPHPEKKPPCKDIAHAWSATKCVSGDRNCLKTLQSWCVREHPNTANNPFRCVSDNGRTMKNRAGE